jgi:hypothetical protein
MLIPPRHGPLPMLLTVSVIVASEPLATGLGVMVFVI